MRIGLVRRGYSASGGAEAYLFRFAEAAHAAGHEPVLICGTEWPQGVWRHEQVCVAGRTPEDFAVRLAERRGSGGWDVLFSLERVWGCDVYRAGDGVHAAWQERRGQFESAWKRWLRLLQRKHREILEIECALFTGGARRIIANSQMVKDEIIAHFGTTPEHVHVIHNGVPASAADPAMRGAVRKELGIPEDEFVALFAGSGWERKGLRHAIEAVNALKIPARLLVAGRGDPRGLPASSRVTFLGPLASARLVAMLAAGLPVITTTANGFSEIIEAGVEGEVVAPGDVKALTAALVAWADPHRRENVRPRLLALALRHSVGENLARTLEVITAAVASAETAAG